jgi:hypothetical protein
MDVAGAREHFKSNSRRNETMTKVGERDGKMFQP